MRPEVILRGNASKEDAFELGKQVVEFLDAVVNKERAPFLRHLKREYFSISILPGDRKILDYETYLEFQRIWNEEKPKASFNYQIELLLLENQLNASVVLMATYIDYDKNKVRFLKKIRIMDSFLCDNGTWYLTKNQNTEIPELEIKPYTG